MVTAVLDYESSTQIARLLVSSPQAATVTKLVA